MAATRTAQLVQALNAIGGEHGVGRIDLLENRLVGMKSRGVYETPGGTILATAHRELEHLTLDKATMRLKDELALTYADLVYNGLWFSPLRQALDAFVDRTQLPVTGDVRMKLYKGVASAVGGDRRSGSTARIWPRSAKTTSTVRPTRRGSSDCSVSVRKSRRSVTVACEKNHWRSRDDEIALAAVGGNLPLSARAASASVPSDALTAARPRNDQRLVRTIHHVQ